MMNGKETMMIFAKVSHRQMDIANYTVKRKQLNKFWRTKMRLLFLLKLRCFVVVIVVVVVVMVVVVVVFVVVVMVVILFMNIL